MSNGSGRPPKGESEVIDVIPQSRPMAATAVDDAWFDDLSSDNSRDDAVPAASTHDAAAPSPAPREPSRSVGSLIPQSLSPMVLRSADAQPSVPPTSVARKSSSGVPAVAGAPAEGADATVHVEGNQHLTRVGGDSQATLLAGGLRSNEAVTVSRSGATNYRKLAVVLSVGVVAAAAILMLTRPKHHPKPIMLERLALPGSAMPQLATSHEASKASQSNLSAPPQPASDGTPPLATVSSAASSASPVASASSGVATPAATDSFADAFKKNAALKDAKWADLKDRSGKSDAAKQEAGKSATGSPAARKVAEPGSADPMDVLKRLEEARKNKKP